MNDLIHKIVGTIIEVGQSDTMKFRLGETIRYTPSEILEILKQHENEIFGEESSTQTNTSNTLNALNCIDRQEAIDAVCMEWCGVKYQECEHPFDIENDESYWCDGCETVLKTLPNLPPAQPELIERTAYIRGFEQGRTQGMIDSQAEEVAHPNLQPTCNQLATDCISRQAAVDDIETVNPSMPLSINWVKNWIKTLPPAQPEITLEIAIDYLHKIGWIQEHDRILTIDRDIPKKPNETTDTAWGIPHRQAVCPNCDCYLGQVHFICEGNKRKVTYCETCGQAIDWEGWETEDNNG